MSTFLNNIDYVKVDNIIEQTTLNVNYFQEITDKVVNSYAESLDLIMHKIYEDIVCVDQPALSTLEKYFLELSNCLYFTGTKLEKLGIYDVMSKNAYKEVYNEKYLNPNDLVTNDAKKKLTVAELTAISEKAAQYEGIVNDVYNKAYKMLKSKIDSATLMLNSMSKIITKRITEMQLSSVNPGGKVILNEDASKWPIENNYHFSDSTASGDVNVY